MIVKHGLVLGIYYMLAIWMRMLRLAMAYSLQLCDIDCDLILAQDREEHFLGLVVLVDNEYVLGYTYGTVEDRQCLDTCSVVESYKTKDLL